VLSKRGLCSRSQAEALVRAGRVTLDGRIVRDPETPVATDRGIVRVDGIEVTAAERVVVMLNKPRGLVTSRADERSRDTVYRCLDDDGLPWLAPVGRLDKASEGLLLFSNDPVWAAAVTAPDARIEKTYHVQIDRNAGDDLSAQLHAGIVDRGERLAARRVEILRRGDKNSWLAIVLDEGRNRHIRRLLAAHGIGVLRLIRVAIGPLVLGDLPKGAWRRLDADEQALLVPR